MVLIILWLVDHTGQSRVEILAHTLTKIRSKSRADLLKVERGTKLDLSQRIVLEGAHREEVIRSIFADDQVWK